MAGAIMVKHFKHSSCFHMRFNINKLSHGAGTSKLQGLLALVIAASHAGAALSADGVELVDEDDARGVLLGLGHGWVPSVARETLIDVVWPNYYSSQLGSFLNPAAIAKARTGRTRFRVPNPPACGSTNQKVINREVKIQV